MQEQKGTLLRNCSILLSQTGKAWLKWMPRSPYVETEVGYVVREMGKGPWTYES